MRHRTDTTAHRADQINDVNGMRIWLARSFARGSARLGILNQRRKLGDGNALPMCRLLIAQLVQHGLMSILAIFVTSPMASSSQTSINGLYRAVSSVVGHDRA